LASEKDYNAILNVKSKQNSIKTTVNTNYERTSEKYKMNNFYLQCDPVEFLEPSKTTMRSYLPKYYLTDKKAYVNIIEACFEMNQTEFDEEEKNNLFTNQELVPLSGDEFLMNEQENSNFDDFLNEEDDVKKTK